MVLAANDMISNAVLLYECMYSTILSIKAICYLLSIFMKLWLVKYFIFALHNIYIYNKILK